MCSNIYKFNEDEKINLVISFDDIQQLSSVHFKILKCLSTDKDAFIRSLCAEQFIKFQESEEALNILLYMAKDGNELVRMAVYDSLGVFLDEAVEKLLHDAILKEVDDLARSYAILSWVEIVYEMNYDISECLQFMQTQKINEISERCLLCLTYGFYLLEEKPELEKLLNYLSSEDPQIRIAVIKLLGNIEFSPEQKEKIRFAIMDLVPKEDDVGVMHSAMKLLDDVFDVNYFIERYNQ